MISYSLEGRHALITGGGTGIGAATARMFADAGARVTITGRREGPLAEVADYSPLIRSAVLDVTDEAATKNVFEEARDAAGPVTICVVNAGIAETVSFRKAGFDFWRKIMATNLDGAYLTMQAAFPQMVEEGWGRMIAMASIAGQRGMAKGTAYSASKHGLIGLARSLAEETLGTGITVNAICPGYVATPIVDRSVDKIKELTGRSDGEAKAALVAANRGGRLVEPEEVADAALWLCGPHSGSFTGQTVQIAGGHV